MTTNTKIEWADHTFNPWVGCTKVGPGCDHCYAEGWAKRSGMVEWGPGAPRRRTTPQTWAQPLKWNKAAKETGTRPRVFCASLADVFDNEVTQAWRYDLWNLIYATPNLDWLLLTKRIGNVRAMAPPEWIAERGHWPANVWLGITVVNQEEADRDIPKLLQVPAAKRFLSIEPMLGPIDLSEWLFDFAPCKNCPCPNPEKSMNGYEDCCREPEMRPSKVDWIIAGGESGPHARPAHPEWFAMLRRQCANAGVPFLFKQWGEWAPSCSLIDPNEAMHLPDCYVKIDGRTHTIAVDDHTQFDSSDALMIRCGKKNAGRVLDGRTHDEFPK